MNDAFRSLKLSSKATKEFWEIPILHEDEELLAIDKPEGLLVSPDHADAGRPSIMGLIQRDFARKANWLGEKGINYLMAAHRLDFETSGVLLLAKSKSTLVCVVEQFGAKRPVCEHLALVHGMPESDEFESRVKLAHHPSRPEIMVASPQNGKFAVTQFRVVERFSGYALVSCRPLTSRTHQIRVHLRLMGHPVVGDKAYGGRELMLSELKPDYRLKPGRQENPLLGRVASHCSHVEIRKPASEEVLGIHSNEPKDIRVALKYLRQLAAL